MKKTICIGLMFCMFMCVGCGKNYEKDLENNQSAFIQKDAAYVTDAQNYYNECTFADDGAGYYFTVMKESGYELFYFDDGMSEAIPLCSKVNCTHSDQTCDAWYTESECMEGFIWYENNSLFRIEQDDATKNVYLISSDRDGGNSKQVSMLWSGDNIRYKFKTIYFRSMIMHKGYLYYTYQLDVNGDIQYYRAPITGGDRELVGTIENDEVVKQFGEVHFSNNNDMIYLSLDASLNEGEERLFLLYQYQISDGKFDNIYKEKGTYDFKWVKDEKGNTVDKDGTGWSGKIDVMELAFDNDGYMYINQMMTGKIIKYNLMTGESKQIYQIEGSGNIAFYNNTLYVNNYDIVDKTKAKTVVLSLDGEVLDEIITETSDMYFGDDKYLFFRYYADYAKSKKAEGTEADYVYMVYDRNTKECKRILQGLIR